MGMNTVAMAMNMPCRPNASGPYKRVIMGAKAIVMACAPAVPEATTATFRTNWLLYVLLKKPWILARENAWLAFVGFGMIPIGWSLGFTPNIF